MKERPVPRLVLSMALPMVLSMMVNSLYNIVDSFFVAKISEEAMTALSLVYPVQNLSGAVAIGFGIGINAAISYHLGAGNQKSADESATMGVFWNVVHGLILTVVCISIMPAFLSAFTSDEVILDYAIRYSRIVFCFAVFNCSQLSFEKIFQAVGRMTTSMFSMLVGCIANIILDPILIFGLGPVPALSIEGAALATGLGQTISFVIYLIIYFSRPIPVRIQRKSFVFRGSIIRKLYSVGVPAILNLALPSLLITALNGILAAYSESYVLVLGVYYKLQTFLYLTSNGIIQGIRPLMGYNYGAGEYGRLKEIYRMALLLSLGIMALGMVLCLTIPGKLFGLFTTEEETIQMGAEALRIICFGFVVSSVSVTTSGALEGLGKGGPSFLISALRYVIFIIPIAFVLSRIIGPTGVWHAFWIAEWLTAGVSWLLYRKEIASLSREKN